ncbi:conserved hypothetical protein [Dethiosulfovibrio peptidovorans DSM 11002]|jgi:uncharacterized GH25 family protein|uniref:ABC-type Co2+ transport system periplasmic component-like protein n=1 Tax=Dethiosulfovibrio peptidovorans DSM 11002 TaxID=469381 RepID=D2Z2I2_9BACT|nr:DUF4198 domain-containing protein [Dethiosulfovibrio peptidovorans]EFC90138.1 conserved hypothetical protein [Dethiosulfovibrio peptidovorans DSM 11002]
MFCFDKKKVYSVFMVAAICVATTATGAQAHDFWVNAHDPEGSTIKADIAYGHDFPNPETIPDGRTHLFNPLYLVTPEGNVDMVQSGENFSYTVEKKLDKGSYIVAGTYKPTYWSKGPDGTWTQTNRKQRPDAVHAEEAIMYAKTILNANGSQDESLITKPLGHRLEIVPLKNPAKVHAGETFPVQVLLDGNPLKLAKLEATFDGFSSNKEHKAFVGRCDLKGRIDIVTLKDGYWFSEVTHIIENEDKSICDEVILVATLTFEVEK